MLSQQLCSLQNPWVFLLVQEALTEQFRITQSRSATRHIVCRYTACTPRAHYQCSAHAAYQTFRKDQGNKCVQQKPGILVSSSCRPSSVPGPKISHDGLNKKGLVWQASCSKLYLFLLIVKLPSKTRAMMLLCHWEGWSKGWEGALLLAVVNRWKKYSCS